MHAMIAVDDQPPIKRRASVIVVGNVGILLANIQLIPGARADDGKLDVLVASPRTLRDWVRLTTRVLTRRRQPDNQLDRMTGRRVIITVEERDQVQLDGDTVGECNTTNRRGRARRTAAAGTKTAQRTDDRQRPGQLGDALWAHPRARCAGRQPRSFRSQVAAAAYSSLDVPCRMIDSVRSARG